MSERVHERVPFRLFRMPCCGHMVCWVNPRSPNYCPECGKLIFSTVKQSVLMSDDEAILTTNRHAGTNEFELVP